MQNCDTTESNIKPVMPIAAGTATSPIVQFPAKHMQKNDDLALCTAITQALQCRINWREAAQPETSDSQLKGIATKLFPRSFGAATKTYFVGHPGVSADYVVRYGHGPVPAQRKQPGLLLNPIEAISKTTGRGTDINVLLASPFGSEEYDADGNLDGIGRKALQGLYETAAIYARKNVCFLVDADQKNAIIRSHLRAGLGAGSLPDDEDSQWDVMTVENGVAALMRNPARWDMVICLPSIRRLLLTIIIEQAGIKGTIPFAFHSDMAAIFGSEQPSDFEGDHNTPSLQANICALSALLSALGMVKSSQRLRDAHNAMMERGVVLDGMATLMPYATSLGAEEYADMLIEKLARPRPHAATFTRAANQRNGQAANGNGTPHLSLVS